jgi:2-polyprenyl-3-methyl-5-hydroxy-6-metoxy-1,4-benzoquinol methylase
MSKSEDKYRDLYSDTERFIDAKLKWRGIHTVVVTELGARLRDARVLDVGCGFGRFSLLAANAGAKVLGVDFMDQAIHVAQVLAKATSQPADFTCADMEVEIPSGEPFDVIYLGGVLEHLSDPGRLLRSAAARLSPGGIIVANCPNEMNPRGSVSATLWLLLDYPMTANDARMITPLEMDELAASAGLSVSAVIGTSYGRGWAQTGLADMRERLPKVVSGLRANGRSDSIDIENFLGWFNQYVNQSEMLLEVWCREGHLRTIEARDELKIDLSVVESNSLPTKAIVRYLRSDFSLDPLYSKVEPFCRFGGQAIYFLNRR